MEHAAQSAVQTMVNNIGDEDISRCRGGLQSGGDIDTIAKEIIVFQYDVTDMHPHSQSKHGGFRQTFLNVDRTLHRVGQADKGDDPTVAHAFNNFDAMFRYRWRQLIIS